MRVDDAGRFEELARDFRRGWRRSLLLRAAVRAFTALIAVALALILLDRGVTLPPDLRLYLRWLPLVAFALFAIPGLARAFPGPDLRRIALLMEERAGDLDHLLTTALDLQHRAPASPAPGGQPDPVAEAFRRRAVARLGAVDPAALLPGFPRRNFLVMASATGAVILLLLLSPGGPSSLWGHWSEAPASGVEGREPGGAEGAEGREMPAGDEAPALGPLRLVVTPPAYTGLPARGADEEDAAAALPGSRIELRGGDPGGEVEVVPRLIEAEDRPEGHEGRILEPRAEDQEWRVSWIFGVEQRGVSVELMDHDDLIERRVIPITALEDRPPEVELLVPDADLLLASPEGSLSVQARASDDYGVEELVLSWIHSSGSGESFSFDEGEWAWDRLRSSGQEVLGESEVDLSALDLRAGDVLHVRAVARDANSVTGPGEGVSATRLIRIARDEEMGDVTTLIGFPIDRDREPLLSQRMIILLTEELIEEAPELDSGTFMARSREIAAEQARLRGRVGEQIFVRAAGAMDDPEAHLEHGAEEHSEEEERSPVPGGEPGRPGDPEAPPEERRSESAEEGYRSMGDLILQDHDHDSNPILGIDDNLLAAYNSMWEAERYLSVGEPAPSLPHQHDALERLQTIREADRVYARGRTRTAPVDVEAARGEGELDDAAPAERSAGAALPSAEAWIAELEELIRVVPALDPLEASAQASGLALRMLADPGGSTEAARLVSRASERVRVPANASEEVRSEAREEALRILSRANELLVPEVRGGSAPPLAAPSTPAGARYLRILRGAG